MDKNSWYGVAATVGAAGIAMIVGINQIIGGILTAFALVIVVVGWRIGRAHQVALTVKPLNMEPYAMGTGEFPYVNAYFALTLEALDDKSESGMVQ
jgi:membrane protein CcdC involved in cytochrome C biogenesis